LKKKGKEVTDFLQRQGERKEGQPIGSVEKKDLLIFIKKRGVSEKKKNNLKGKGR